MKKSVITIFLVLTTSFAAFVGGFYYGRNFSAGDVYISGLLESVPATAVQAAVPTVTTKPQEQTQHPSSPAATVPATTVPAGPLMININTATLEELDLLPGIGPVIAQAIIDYRTEYGDFETPEDLLNVSGIGEKRLDAILEFITTGG